MTLNANWFVNKRMSSLTLYILVSSADTFRKELTQISPRSEVIKLFSRTTHLSIKLIMLLNVEMPTIIHEYDKYNI